MRAKCCAFLIGLLVAAPVLAARPVKQATPAVPVVVDAAGVIVGPVVPVADSSRPLAAVYRVNGERIKILFYSFKASTEGSRATSLAVMGRSPLYIRGPVALWFPESQDCTGPGYVQDTDFIEPDGASTTWNSVVTREYKGYSPVYVYPKSNLSTSVGQRTVQVNWDASPLGTTGQASSRMRIDSVCEWNNGNVFTTPGALLFPITFGSDLNFSSPFTVE